MKAISRAALVVGLAITSIPSLVQAQTWTNWLFGNVPGMTVSGSLSGVGVNVSGNVAGYQLTDGTTGNISSFSQFVMPAYRSDMNFWVPSGAYTQGGLVAPQPMGLVQMIEGGSVLITFTGGSVVNPFIAINSLGNPLSTPANAGRNTATMTFGGGEDTGAQLLSSNNGDLADAYWLGGKCVMQGNSLIGDECSGVVQLKGTYSSLLITGTTENWYGFTVGTESVVPEPSTYALMAVGLLSLGVVSRRRKRSVQQA